MKEITSTSSAGSPILCGKIMNLCASEGRDSTFLMDFYTAMSDRDGNLLGNSSTYQTGYQIWLFPWGGLRATPNSIAAWQHSDYWQFEHITFSCFHHNSSDLASFFQYISHQTCDKRYSHYLVELFLSFIHSILLSIVFFSKHTCNQSNFVYFCSEISYLKITSKIFS